MKMLQEIQSIISSNDLNLLFSIPTVPGQMFILPHNRDRPSPQGETKKDTPQAILASFLSIKPKEN